MQFSMTEHGFQGDLPFGKIEVSAKDEHGFRPFQLLVSSIAVCSGGVLRNILEKMRMPATHISIEVKEVQRNENEANRIENIHLHFILEGEKIQEAKLPRVFELVKSNCSMVQSVIQSIDVHETYEVK
ncbi:MAG TPA: OsmC family protein [Sporosarcina sp.]|nr:OsmC family protein [Sporosarcina sp.]